MNIPNLELNLVWVIAASTAIIVVFGFLRKVNEWHYVARLGTKRSALPPGDMGWPLLGKFLSFARAFRSEDPDSFINDLVSRYGRTGLYKTHLFCNPSIVVCKPEFCWRVLADDIHFQPGYPRSTVALLGTRILSHASAAQHKRIRRLTTAPIVGHNALAVYIERIEDIVISSLEEMASMKHPIELLEEIKKVTFKVILHIFMGSTTNNHSVITKIGDLFTPLINGIYSLPINAPGFTFHKAIKARRKLGGIVKPVVEERRRIIERNGEREIKKDLIDILLEAADEDGRKLGDDEIIELLVLFLIAGHETSALGMLWSIIYLTDHPHIMIKAKEEIEEIVKTRPVSQNRLNLEEIKQMVYLAKVVDETLRYATISFSIFREANVDVDMNGYIIPKGWRVMVWARAVHMDPENYPNPHEFNPSRWDDYKARVGCFIPFGAGMRLCPGADLAKLEISIFLHYFLLNYKLERVNPKCPVTSLPVPRPTDNCLARIIKLDAMTP